MTSSVPTTSTVPPTMDSRPAESCFHPPTGRTGCSPEDVLLLISLLVISILLEACARAYPRGISSRRSARAGLVDGRHAHVLGARAARLVDHFDQPPGRHLVVGHDQYRTRRRRGQQVPDPALDDPDANRLAVQVDVAGVVDIEPNGLGRGRTGRRCAGAVQVELHVLDEGGRDHEEDQQDEHHVDQRRDVDALFVIGTFAEPHAAISSAVPAQSRSLIWASSWRMAEALRSRMPPMISPGMATARPI